jgi:hypothetical protein
LTREVVDDRGHGCNGAGAAPDQRTDERSDVRPSRPVSVGRACLGWYDDTDAVAAVDEN